MQINNVLVVPVGTTSEQADNTGNYNARTVIQGVINDAADAANPAKNTPTPTQPFTVFIPAGTYKITGSLFMRSYVTVICAPGTVILRDSTTNADFKIGFDGVTDAGWIGGTFLRASGEAATGSIFVVGTGPKDATTQLRPRSQRILIQDVTVRGWKNGTELICGYSGGNAILIDGDDIRLLNMVLRDPRGSIVVDGKRYVGSGAVRVTGGRRITIAGGFLESNDDTIALVPSDVGNVGGNLDGMASIEDVVIANVGLKANEARALNIGMSEGSNTSNENVGRWRAQGAFRMAGGAEFRTGGDRTVLRQLSNSGDHRII